MDAPAPASPAAQAVAVREERPTTMLNIIASVAMNPDADVAKLAALLDMQDRVMKREAEAEFNKALAHVTANMPHIPKNGRVELGGGKGYNFATLPDMDAALRPLMAAVGLSLMFSTETVGEGGQMKVIATLMHIAGHSRSIDVTLPVDTGAGRGNLQARGSTMKYAMRYLERLMFNIVDDEDADDDGLRGGVQTVDERTAAEITALIEETQPDMPRFWKFAKVSRVVDIEMVHANAVLAMLRQKKQDLQRAEPGK